MPPSTAKDADAIGQVLRSPEAFRVAEAIRRSTAENRRYGRAWALTTIRALFRISATKFFSSCDTVV
jgi:hypothetical protein